MAGGESSAGGSTPAQFSTSDQALTSAIAALDMVFDTGSEEGGATAAMTVANVSAMMVIAHELRAIRMQLEALNKREEAKAKRAAQEASSGTVYERQRMTGQAG